MKSTSPEYIAWANLIARCTVPTHPSYHRYGGRGIGVDPRWLVSFDAFLNDVGQRPSPKHSLDRIDNQRGYHPDNCRWATGVEQHNNKSNNHKIDTPAGRMGVTEAARHFGIGLTTLTARLRRGIPPAEALTTPPRDTTIETPRGRMTPSEAAKEFGIHLETIRFRMKKRLPMEEVFKPVDRHHFVDTPDGKMTLAQAARHYGIGFMTLRGRITRGWTITDAVRTPVMSPEPKNPAAEWEDKQCQRRAAEFQRTEEERREAFNAARRRASKARKKAKRKAKQDAFFSKLKHPPTFPLTPTSPTP